MKNTIEIYKNNIIEFLRDKKFIITLILVSILAYGFTLSNVSIGVDDLSLDKYVNDTYILSQGRWGTFFIYNLLGIREFTPFWLDFVTLILMFCTAIFLCTLFKRVSKDKIKKSSYIIFACVFIACPVIAYFFVYQPTKLTVGLGNLLVAIAVSIIYENLINENKFKNILITILILSFAISMYESCAQTFIVLIFIINFIVAYFENDKKFKYFFTFTLKSMIILAISVVIHFIIKTGICVILDMLNIRRIDYANRKNIIMLIKECETFQVFRRVCEIKFTKLFKNTIFQFFSGTCIVGLILSAIKSIKTKNNNIFIMYLGIVIGNILLLLYMTANLYRVYYSWAIGIGITLLFINEFFYNKKSKVVVIFIAYVILIETKTMNGLFYKENLEYKKNLNYANNIITELLAIDDSLNKPILFVGNNRKATFSEIKEDYMTWALLTFNGECTEVISFFEHMGYDINLVDDRDQALKVYENLDEEEKQKSIIDLEDFIVVKISE